MIIGVGVDIVEIRRINEAVERNDNFINKLFDKEEIDYLKSRGLRPEYIAGRFAAKEAVSKALGTGIRGFGFRDIIIDRTTLGKPIVVLKGKAKMIAQKNGEYKIHLSISHGEDSAIAYAVIETVDQRGITIDDCHGLKRNTGDEENESGNRTHNERD